MWWFDKGKREEIRDDEVQWPIGDIEAAHRIRDICRSAADRAEQAGRVAEDDKNDKNDKNKDSRRNTYETDRYERAAKAAMEIAIGITDDL
jgi:hypothetical protein